ncbi:MAG: hypothetical protein K0R82_2447 [Flavipsychrobacter sp.]|nr:hypothetical protein [Flavipsychrobacter sp.]
MKTLIISNSHAQSQTGLPIFFLRRTPKNYTKVNKNDNSTHENKNT